MKTVEPSKPRLVILVIILMLLAALLAWRRMQPKEHEAVGNQLTAFSLSALTEGSGELRLPHLKGKVVLVNFWGPWCHLCRHEFPHLRAIHEEFQNRSNYRTLLVSCSAQIGGDMDELQTNTIDFMQQRNWDIPVYTDPLARTRLMLEAEGLRPFGYPTTVILDGDSVIRGIWLGYNENNAAEMRQVLSKLLPASE